MGRPGQDAESDDDREDDLTMYGRRVMGDEAWQAHQAAAQRSREQGLVLGPRVTGEAPTEPVVVTTGEGVTAEPEDRIGDEDSTEESVAVSISITEMSQALAANQSVAFFDTLLEAEFARPEGAPRKGALQLLVKAETARGDEAREPVLIELRRALEG